MRLLKETSVRMPRRSGPRVLGFVYRAQEDPRVTRNGGGIGSPLRPTLQVTVGRAALTAGARQDPVEGAPRTTLASSRPA